MPDRARQINNVLLSGSDQTVGMIFGEVRLARYPGDAWLNNEALDAFRGFDPLGGLVSRAE